MNNITLIGMPGVGKSTIGVVLAKVLGYQFLDSDLLIQKQDVCVRSLKKKDTWDSRKLRTVSMRLLM